ncbi:DNA/RNA non-specific endonuclease [Mangrovimonas sp. DI 80]|uniref:DNA/RNA non-specific endonuclease n=1 Tax=Mangrovimonas sp. DI 80 TaxID=1779330 RepID=UPI000977F557|nr:DNA/RNA non-specific endonuclease [Mangrovimonas sp. DI 80]OMP30990.1 endonuclease [Mangrovimonas sp. DI 80]
MTKRLGFAILALGLGVGVLWCNEHLEKLALEEAFAEASLPKSETKLRLLPKSTMGQVIHHDSYSLSYSEEHEQAEWVAYELRKDHLSDLDFKRPYFEIDSTVKTGAAHWRNYKNSGYDRGHLCPAGDRRYSLEAYYETFLTSNISPQDHYFNAGVWNRLEEQTRRWAKEYNSVFVVTGGVLTKNLKTIGEEHVSVPDYFYKVIFDDSNSEVKIIAFLIPAKESSEHLNNFVVSVDSLEHITGIDFFPELEDNLENTLEASEEYSDWEF